MFQAKWQHEEHRDKKWGNQAWKLKHFAGSNLHRSQQEVQE